jgi:hypothetical protein
VWWEGVTDSGHLPCRAQKPAGFHASTSPQSQVPAVVPVTMWKRVSCPSWSPASKHSLQMTQVSSPTWQSRQFQKIAPGVNTNGQICCGVSLMAATR